ncbi:glutathione S-transferase family protein [Bradyrhizobium sp. LHD-71]|uniref:glutathione S-transferase family protein n=1 Tax=Bradyrhizobium sp. LHD-71 TaxID=3072141 RepID=UPI00280D05B6|nr:glutathione S-transferase family protein [Bradyrhizobium sp. LHD-71]MDQ8730606.1 glutathione S-transferase family protein [Bradyrhizobium sp. LHD-71]
MSLTFYFHPLSSYCQKVLIALYENDTPFDGQIVDLMSETGRADYLKLWPIGKMPLLRDEARNRLIPETSIIIEYLQRFYGGPTVFVPDDVEQALHVRLRDRFFDLYVSNPMQKIVTDKLRPAGQNDPAGVVDAKSQIETAYKLIDKEMATKVWACGEAFTLADCAAAPPLFYADKVLPFRDRYQHLAAYFERLQQRPSYARTLREAEPYMKMFPG